jgi:hypothetical protein
MKKEFVNNRLTLRYDETVPLESAIKKIKKGGKFNQLNDLEAASLAGRVIKNGGGKK